MAEAGSQNSQIQAIFSEFVHATDSIEYSANISRILNSLDIKEDEEENDESV